MRLMLRNYLLNCGYQLRYFLTYVSRKVFIKIRVFSTYIKRHKGTDNAYLCYKCTCKGAIYNLVYDHFGNF